MDWMITKKDQKLAEIVDKALHEKRQRIQTDEGVVIVISQEELERIEGTKKNFVEHLLSIPKSEDTDRPCDREASPDPDDTGRPQNSLIEYLKNGPGFEGVDISRDRSPARDIEW
jgi:hypothetical protein